MSVSCTNKCLLCLYRSTIPVGAVVGSVLGGLVLIIFIVVVIVFSTRTLYKRSAKYTFKAVRLTVTIKL